MTMNGTSGAATGSDRSAVSNRATQRATLGLSLAATLLAGGAAAQQMRSAEAHQHGTSNVEIAVEGDALQIRLFAPAADIVGFEHAVTSEEDRRVIDAALEVLTDPLALFGPPDAANCEVAHADVSITSDMADVHDDAGHDDDHAGHGDDHADEAHLEFVATYHLECQRIEAVDRLAMTFFEQFPNARQLEFTILSAGGAETASAGRDDDSIPLDLGD